ncbi:hypothetical protein QUF63_05000 [Anaerolineales bacterium HSG25]|nr:hypothetical protein [Anaerolineales bacterium HSG25]
MTYLVDVWDSSIRSVYLINAETMERAYYKLSNYLNTQASVLATGQAILLNRMGRQIQAIAVPIDAQKLASDIHCVTCDQTTGLEE